MALTKVTSGLISADASSVDLNIDAGTLYIDATNNRVGVANTSPATALDVTGTVTSDGLTVDGTATISGASTAGFVTPLLAKNPSTNAASSVKIGLDAGGTTWGEIGASYNTNDPYMAFFVRSGSEKVRITDAGNVGIGTSSPTDAGSSRAALHINGANGAGLTLSKNSANLSYIYTSGTNGEDLTFYNDGVQNFYTNGSERMRIDSSGNVGIGTSTTTNGQVTISHAAGNTLNLNKTGGAALAFTYAGFATDALIEGLANGGLRIYTGNTPAERMRITSSGYVGIGTSSPAHPLHVNGLAQATNLTTTSDSLWFLNNTNATANGYINYYSYQNGTTQYRNLIIANGRGGTIATFTGSSLSLNVVGALSKGSGSFKIDHPLKPETHHLVHSFVEAPQADLYYRGKVSLVDGVATVNIDETAGMTEGTFVALCRDIQCFTSNEESWTNVRGSVSGNILTIEAQDSACADLISWLVVGERKDQHMYDTDWTDDEGRVIVEPEKTETENQPEPLQE